MSKRTLRMVLGWTVVIVTTAFFIRALAKNWGNIQQLEFSFNAYSAISIILFAFAVIYSGVLWGKLVQTLTGEKITLKEATRVHISSWLLKYIPGQAGSYINKVAWASEKGISKKAVSVSFIYENVFLLLASLALSVPVIGFIFYEDVSGNWSLFVPLLLGIPLIAVVMNQRVFYRLMNIVFKKLRGQTISKESFLPSSQIFLYFLQFIVPRVITGIAFLFVAASFLPIEPSMYIGLAATYILAGIIGLLAVFVPSGLGVREAVIVVFASNYFSVEAAIALSLVARLYATVADGVLAGLYFILKQKVKNT